MIIRDQFDPDLRKLIKKKKQIAIIPVGSIEQHGPHLPISTDSDIVTEISLQLSDKINGVLLPTINYGISDCLLYTSPSPRDQRGSRMPSSA